MNKTQYWLNQARGILTGLLFFTVWLLSSVSNPVLAGQRIDLRPGDSFENAVESLQPGDVLVIHSGTYSGVGRISISAQGTAQQPVIIKAASGEARPLITRPANTVIQNTINIEGASYLTIQGLEISGNGGDAIRVDGPSSHDVVLQDLLIHDIDVGINTKSDSDHFTIRDNHIYNTGANQGTGEGMYIGCHQGDCALRDSVIEHNLIHDTLPGTTQGDGIEIKLNSENIVIRDNVIYNRPFPGIFVYGGGTTNLVEGNVVWNSLEGIAAISDAVVRNNILFDNDTGLISFHHPIVAVVENTSFIHNTVYNNDVGALLRWEDATDMVFANNAVYSPRKVAIDSNSASNTVSTNVTLGSVSDTTRLTNANRFIDARSAELDFKNAPDHDFWPTAQSPMIVSADPGFAVANDFNNQSRQLPADIGAYQRSGLTDNPGWKIESDFKGILDRVNPPDVEVASPSEQALIFSTSTAINHQWKSIEIPSRSGNSGFSPIIVITSIPTTHGAQPGVVQINNSGANQIDVRFKEYEYLDGFHVLEHISILAITPGVYNLDDGTIMEIGTFDITTTQWQSMDFSADFPSQPKLFLTVQTANSDTAVTPRARNITPDHFKAALFQQESNQGQLVSERVGFLAIYHPDNRGTLNIDSATENLSPGFQLSRISINHNGKSIANSRIRLEEEQSNDTEHFHVNENVDILQLGDVLFGQIVSNRGADPAALRIR
ncbi:MAG TPA: hypothetical protein ENJ32_10240 [Crenotrichaceae bacterium]|nr:hypothetical protein [Crenotrichaceae bacterium]